MNLQDICSKVVMLSRETGVYLREENTRLDQSGIKSKGRNDYVTYVDKESERRLVEELSMIFPGAGFLTEEGTVELHGEEYYWVIDPLDGTTNYIHRLAPYSISIGLMRNREVLLGCVYEVTMDEAFYAWKEGGAWLNDKKIHVSEKEKLENSVIAHGIPYVIEPKYEYLRRSVARFYGKCTLRHLGSAAAEICYIASGRVDAYFHDNLSPWDVTAGTLILQEAGGKVTDFSGGDNFIFGKELIASNGLIHEELTEMLLDDKTDCVCGSIGQ